MPDTDLDRFLAHTKSIRDLIVSASVRGALYEIDVYANNTQALASPARDELEVYADGAQVQARHANEARQRVLVEPEVASAQFDGSARTS